MGKRILIILLVVIIGVLVNYSLGWTYEQGEERHEPQNDTVIVVASHRYERITPLKWLFLGRNYRREWSVPVAMPVFQLHATKGGFTIEKLGGGEQTVKLVLRSNNDGLEWELRSVDKNVTNALPEKLRNTFVHAIVQDGISAAYPYALMTVQDLSEAIGLPAFPVGLYYVPDDTALGDYRSAFAHTVCFLMPDTIGNQLTVEKTDTMKLKLIEDSRYSILQEQVLKSRLFDMLIADWDRHKNQWDWVMIDSADTVLYYPAPKDRDQAFFRAQGIIPFLVRVIAMPHLIGFRKNPKRLDKLNHKSHEFDRYYLSDLDKDDWSRIIREFQANLTNEVIDAAVKKLPPEVYGISGKDIKNKLISRRNGMLKNALDYYDFLSREITISSSNAAEIFSIVKAEDRMVIRIVRLESKRPVYHRAFYPHETKTINIVNIGSDDSLRVTGDAETIRLLFKYADKVLKSR